MKIKDIMTGNVFYCTPESLLEEAARLMQQHDCGALPVVDSMTFRRPVGMIYRPGHHIPRLGAGKKRRRTESKRLHVAHLHHSIA